MQNKLYSDEYYLEKAMEALAPIIENDYQARCLCGYKSRTSMDRGKVERLGNGHALKTGHRVVLLNHRIGVDMIGGYPQLTPVDDEPPPF